MKNKNKKANGRPALFEINLLGDRANSLRRRRMLHQFGALIALGIIILGGVAAVSGAVHLATGMRVSLGIRRLAGELAEQRQLCHDMDALRVRALTRLEPIAPLIPVMHRRVRWTPKLTALAESLPPASGVLSVHASNGELFKMSNASSAAAQRAARTRMEIAVLYSPASGTEEHPISLLEHLRASEAFMEKMDHVRLEATETDNWNGQPVVVLRSSAKGKVIP